MGEKASIKPKVMMHYVKPGSTGGPNVLFKRIENAPQLNEKYEFVHLNQNRVAGGKINFSLIWELKKEISKIKPDIIHISGMQSSGFHCMVAAVLAGCRNRLVTTHGFSGDAINISKIKKNIFNKIIEPLTLVLATHVQCISKFTIEKKMVKKYAKNKSCYIYNYPPSKDELSTDKNIRKKLGIGSEEVVFTSVSRIVLDKGYKELAEAIKSLKDLKNIRFLIVGDGDYEGKFANKVSQEIRDGKVIMLGKTDDVLDILNESDVFVLPTLHENLGNVFLEASTVGIPSIGTNVGGVPEIVSNGVTGLLIPPYNSNALTNSIRELYSKPEVRKEMGLKAKERLLNNFNATEISNKFSELYSLMLNN
ncbi:glycosyltransferase [Robertmurraya korlensis]|uniref:glycosyltransferase n=1 Tax=Robertmurraya korlensis TaxID=519977 RepID=UPI0008265F7E|nr:glycosyltransferase [Robertmurraya korlensis]